MEARSSLGLSWQLHLSYKDPPYHPQLCPTSLFPPPPSSPPLFLPLTKHPPKRKFRPVQPPDALSDSHDALYTRIQLVYHGHHNQIRRCEYHEEGQAWQCVERVLIVPRVPH